MIFKYPSQAFYGKVIPKNKFYKNVAIPQKTKEMFVAQVKQVRWMYKISPETINILSTNTILDIQVFEITLKKNQVSDFLLFSIDQAIQHPIIFEIVRDNGLQTICAFKSQNILIGGKSKKLSRYFQSKIVDANTQRKNLDISLNLGSTYYQIIELLCETNSRPREILSDYIQRDAEIFSKKREVQILQKKILSCKQFNKKMQLNSKLRMIHKELEILV